MIWHIHGVRIILGENEPSLLKAAHNLGKAILNDLKAMKKGTIDRQRVADIVDEHDVKEKRKITITSSTTQNKVEETTRALLTEDKDAATEESCNNKNTAVENTQVGKESGKFSNQDTIMLLVIDIEESQDISTHFFCPVIQPHIFHLFFFVYSSSTMPLL